MSNTQITVINPSKDEFETIQRQCKMAVLSGFLPDAYRGNGPESLAKACVIAMKGRELGIPMMQAFSQINIIKGKPAISAELMMAMIYRAHPKANINFTVLTNEECEIKAARPGGEPTIFKFTMEDAKRAQLVRSGSGWEKYPRAMLRSRAVSEMARSLFPDALMGCSYTPEELGADVNEDGEVVRNVGPAQDLTEKKPEVSEPPPQNHEVIQINDKEPEIDPLDEILGDNDPPPTDHYAPGEDDPEWMQNVNYDTKNADYVIKIGKYKGQRIKDVDLDTLKAYCGWVKNKAQQDNKQITGAMKELIDLVEI